MARSPNKVRHCDVNRSKALYAPDRLQPIILSCADTLRIFQTYLRFDACVELQKHLNTFPTYDLQSESLPPEQELVTRKGHEFVMKKAFPLACVSTTREHSSTLALHHWQCSRRSRRKLRRRQFKEIPHARHTLDCPELQVGPSVKFSPILPALTTEI